MPEEISRPCRTLAVFDFDGTLSRHDSFVPFLRFAFGNWVFLRKLLRLALPALGFLCGRRSRDALKGELIGVFLSGVPADWVRQKAAQYCAQRWPSLMRPKGIAEVSAQLASGALVTLCSASPQILLEPFAERLGVALIGTLLEEKEGLLTGRLSGDNCRCAAKVARLEAVYGALAQYHLRAWGDSRGDRELLACAQEAHFKPFRAR